MPSDATATKRVRPVRAVVGVTVTVLGAGALLAGWQVESCAPYLSSVLSNAGVALFLVLPLLVVERVLEKRVAASEARTEQQVTGVRGEVAAVRDEVARLGELREMTEERVSGVDPVGVVTQAAGIAWSS